MLPTMRSRKLSPPARYTGRRIRRNAGVARLPPPDEQRGRRDEEDGHDCRPHGGLGDVAPHDRARRAAGSPDRHAACTSSAAGTSSRRAARAGRRVAGTDEPLRVLAHQFPARIREQQVHVDDDEEALQHRAERVRDGVVRLDEAREQHAEPDEHHQLPGPVPRPSRPADQPRENERAADEQQQRSRLGRVLLVVARLRERDRDRARDQRNRAEDEPEAPSRGHAVRSAAIAAPDRSAFGTKPRAPLHSMQRP